MDRSLLLHLLLSLSLSLFLSPFSHAALQPVPDWVVPQALPVEYSTPLADTQDGVHYLLLDSQINASAPVQAYTRMAIQILNQTGVESQSQLNFDFDPSYQQLAVHNIGVIRNGKYLDRYDSADIKQLQRETELENLIHNGLHTQNLVLKDIRIGDVLTYSYTIRGQNPVYAGHFGAGQQLSWSVPIERVNLNLLWPHKRPLYLKLHNADLAPEVSREGGMTRYALQLQRPAVTEREADTPEWFSPWAEIEFSEFDSWGGVVDWALPLYRLADHSPAEIRALAHRIKLSQPDIKAQIADALRFAQGEIRYLGLELGQDSHRPASAAETLERRFGDCKAKAVLFNELLRALGIQAYPALVNTHTRYSLIDQLPAITAFNHVITYLELEGRAYWIDPTRRAQPGSLDDVHQPQYGYGLIIRPGSKALTAINPGPEANSSHITDTFRLSDEQSANLQVESQFGGADAERLRAQFESKSLSEFEKEYLEYYRKWYGELTAEETIAHRDAQSGNHFTVLEKYRIDNFWDRQDNDRTADFYAYYLYDELKKPGTVNRSQPYELAFPRDITQVISVYLPDADWSFESENLSLDNDFFEFSKTVNFDKANRHLTLSYRYKTLIHQVPAERMADYAQAVGQAREHLDYGIYHNLISPSLLDDLQPMHFVWILAGLYLLLLIYWLIEKKMKPEPTGGVFFPVSTAKFLAMYLLTFGIYGIYWFYQNFNWLKAQRQDDSMPVFRALFSPFWFYPLWKAIKEYGQSQQLRHQLPHLAIGAAAAIAYFLAAILSNRDSYVTYGLLLGLACLIPMVNFVAYANRDCPELLQHHSRFTPRHGLLALISIPLLGFVMGSTLGFMPGDKVVTGEQLIGYAKKEILRTGAVRPDDTLVYFYSNGIWSFREDGNGITNRHVFSYWSEDGVFSLETAEFDQVAELKLTKSSTWSDNSILTITRKDGSDFLLFLSNQERGDDRFYHALNQRVNEAKSLAGQQGEL